MSDINRLLNQIGRQISDWVRENSDSATGWWEAKSAIQSRQSQIRRLIRQRNETTMGIGSKVYTLHKRGKVRNRDLVADCDRLDQIGERIEELKHEIEELRDRERGLRADEPEIGDDSPVVGDEDVDTAVAVETEAEEGDSGADYPADDTDRDAYDVGPGPGEDAGGGAPC